MTCMLPPQQVDRNIEQCLWENEATIITETDAHMHRQYFISLHNRPGGVNIDWTWMFQ